MTEEKLDYKLIKMQGTLEVPNEITLDDFIDEFIDFVESRNSLFSGYWEELEGMTEKLKPCPFCGSENVEAFTDDIQAFSWGRMLELSWNDDESGNRRRKHRSLESEGGMKVYIAGPMTGYKNFNRETFILHGWRIREKKIPTATHCIHAGRIAL